MPIHGYPGNVITANPVAPTSTVATGVWTTEQQLKAVAAGNWPFTIPTQQISLSARFNSADSAYLSRTFGTSTNQSIFTYSAWVKLARAVEATTNYGMLIVGRTASTDTGYGALEIYNGVLRFGGWTSLWRATTQVFRDPSAWYHIVLAVDTTQATAANRIKLYLNGVEITAFGTSNNPTQNATVGINNNSTVARLGGDDPLASSRYWDGYMAEVNFIDGQALTPASFGQINAGTGVWEPIPYTGTYGTNGFELPFNFDSVSFSADFLVVAGGGAGGGAYANNSGTAAGGGAGGYRTSAGTSGGGGSAESALSLSTGTPYTITVGAGGASIGNASGRGNTGSNSVFSTITSSGGGGGGAGDVAGQYTGGNGGSGGGGASGGGFNTAGGTGTANQGYAGGESASSGTPSGGGGGAGAVGQKGGTVSATSGAGGAGVASSITGSSVTRAGGGGGGGSATVTSSGAGGTGGGGAGGAYTFSGTAGTANTGGGGGAMGASDSTGSKTSGAGGSGVVIIKIADTRTATFSSGVTSSLSTAVSGFKIYTVTATSTTSETVTFT